MRKTWPAFGVILALALGGCQSGSSTSSASSAATVSTRNAATGASPSPTASPTVVPVSLSITPAKGASSVRLDATVSVIAAGGTLQSVAVSTKDGKVVTGALDPAKASWKSATALASGKTYTVTATAQGESGTPTTTTSEFSTLTPKLMASTDITPSSGSTVGIGMPIIVNFRKSGTYRSAEVKNKSAVLKALSVKTTPQVEGAWHWNGGAEVQWRPKTYWPAGTKVTVTAAIAGVEVSPGRWGKVSNTHTFTIGSAMISTVNVDTHEMTVRRDGKVIKVIPVSTGRSTARFRSRNGIKVIMSREMTHQMDSSTVGIKKGDPEYYNLTVHYAMRVTNSGEFLHAAPWNNGYMGRVNHSHGCTGMSTTNARWMYNNSKVGDVVIYVNSPRQLEWDNGYTAWNMSYSQWAAGS